MVKVLIIIFNNNYNFTISQSSLANLSDVTELDDIDLVFYKVKFNKNACYCLLLLFTLSSSFIDSAD